MFKGKADGHQVQILSSYIFVWGIDVVWVKGYANKQNVLVLLAKAYYLKSFLRSVKLFK